MPATPLPSIAANHGNIFLFGESIVICVCHVIFCTAIIILALEHYFLTNSFSAHASRFAPLNISYIAFNSISESYIILSHSWKCRRGTNYSGTHKILQAAHLHSDYSDKTMA